ncbi:Oidioi.mRNA.OKI2018_I69.PAR.g11218.t1.cds [Oikopleura dioica]|uniref:Oidioi.mRNA.OKI2018_I69.PAR.g11218.t1.cds n=1 Tax=Oikopleura dioica TaxID=34765 RepID=A0ABN7RUU0_OIKDI|nr:Oidioi.mRNA.OKI2018_I69.PAR.g11218.t1.cds [Oikopleura dioica]
MKSLKLISSKQSNGEFKICQAGQPEIKFEDGKPVQSLRFTLEVPLFSEQVYSLQGFGNEEPAMTITSEAQPQVSCPGSTRSDLQNLKTTELKTTRRFYWEEGQLFMNLQTRFVLTANLSIINQVEIKEVTYDMDKASTRLVPVNNDEFRSFINRNPIFDKEGNVVSIDPEENGTACVPTEVTIPVFGAFSVPPEQDVESKTEPGEPKQEENEESKIPEDEGVSKIDHSGIESGYDSFADGDITADDRTSIESDFSTWEDEEDDILAEKHDFPDPTEALSRLILSS